MRPTGCCPICRQPLQRTPSLHLHHLLEVYDWYEEGCAPDAHRQEEHAELLCAVHFFQCDEYTHFGEESGWPKTLDVEWIKEEVREPTEHCNMLITHAVASEQYLNMVELLETGTPDVYTSSPPLSVYHRGHGWLRSAG